MTKAAPSLQFVFDLTADRVTRAGKPVKSLSVGEASTLIDMLDRCLTETNSNGYADRKAAAIADVTPKAKASPAKAKPGKAPRPDAGKSPKPKNGKAGLAAAVKRNLPGKAKPAPAKAAPKPKADQSAQALKIGKVGLRLGHRVKYRLDGETYKAHVVALNPAKGAAKIRFDDDDTLRVVRADALRLY